MNRNHTRTLHLKMILQILSNAFELMPRRYARLLQQLTVSDPADLQQLRGIN